MLSSRKKEQLVKDYNSLSVLYKRILQLKAIFFDLEYKTPFFECIRNSDLRNAKGTLLQINELNQILEQFIANGFIKKKNLAIEPAIYWHIMQDALQGEYTKFNLKVIAQAQGHREKPLFNYNSNYDLRAINVALHANIPDLFMTPHKDVEEQKYFDLLLETLHSWSPIIDFNWISSLNPAIQLCFCLSRLAPQITSKEICQNDFNKWAAFYKAHEFPKTNDYLAYIKIQTDLSVGKLPITQKQIAQFAEDRHYPYTTQGTLAFLNKDFAQALNYYKIGLKLEKTRTKKRAWVLNDFHGMFYILTLVITGELLAAIDAIQTLEKIYTSQVSSLFIGIKAILFLQHGESYTATRLLDTIFHSLQEESKNYPKGNVAPMLLAILAFANYLVDPEEIKTGLLPYCAEQFNVNPDYILATHLSAEILFAVEKKQIYQNFLTTSPLGKFRFLELIQVKSEWECILDKLNNVLIPTASSGKGEENFLETKRLTWLVDPEHLNIEIVEQKQKAKGIWSKGKPISLKRLYHGELKPDYLTDQDKLALRGLYVETHGWYNQENFSWNLSTTLPALIGSPNVCHLENRNIPLELIKGEAELNIEEVKDGYRFSLSHYAVRPTVILEKEKQDRYKVINYTEKMVTISNILPEDGLTVPTAAKDQVLNLIKQASNNTIHINTNVGGLEIPMIDGDVTCWLHILPVGEGLKINLGIRPFGEEGPFYRAGQGSATVIATLKTPEGKEVRKRTLRDFKAEKQSAKDFIKNCPTLEAQNDGEDQWRFEDLETCLEVLTEIDKYSPLNVEWPQGQSLAIKQTISAKNLLLKVTGSNNWFEYDGEIALNDEKVLSMEILLSLLEGNSIGRFVKLDNGEFLALTNSFKKRLEELKVASEGKKIFHLGFGLLENLAQDVKSLEVDQAWHRQLKKIKAIERHNPKVPTTLQATLRDYQQDGFKYLSRLSHWGIGACLADDMGLGKTVQTIALLLEQAAIGPTLVIAPTSVCFNWIDEITKFAPTLNIHTLHGNNDRLACIEKLTKRDVLICSYGLLQQVGEDLINKHWQTIVLDEAQAIKNPQTLRWKYAVKLNGNCRIALTGTPIENHIGELWSIFRFLNPGLLGSPNLFQQRFAYPIEKYNNATAKVTLKQLVQPYILRRLKSQVLDELPAKTEQTIIIEPTDAEMAFYEALRRQALERISNLELGNQNTKRFSILAEITKLRQACCHSCLIDESVQLDNSKIKIFLEIVQELIENNHKALVFSQYVRYLAKIKEVLTTTNIKYQYIDGQTPAKARKEAVEKFQAGEGDIFLLSLKAGGTGLNLTAADYVLHLDPWWNPAVEDQASDRAHRIGQQRPVTIYRLIIKNSIEEKIIQMHKDKRDLATDLLSGGDVSSKMSEEELLALIA